MDELRDLVDVLYEASHLVKNEVEKIVQKGDMTPGELENVYKATCMTEKLMKMQGQEDEGMSYGYPNRYNMGYSERRGRSPVTGRYISRGMNRGGYSGHSIEDRMIASLEEQYDNAQSEHERKVIQEEIDHIRNGR